MENKAKILTRLVDYLFGYDFFISYCWKDGREYAVALHNNLQELGFNCFLDSSDYAKGDHWRNQGKRALKKTSRLILIVTPEALKSEPVNNELRIFTELGRRILPIDINNTLSNLNGSGNFQKYLNAEILRITDLVTATKQGPSEHVVTEITNTFELIRQDTKRLRAVSVVAVVFFVVSVIAASLGFVAENRRVLEKKARTEAEAATTRSNLRLAQVFVDAGEFDRANTVLSKVPETARNWVWRNIDYQARPYDRKWEVNCTVKGISVDANNIASAFCFDGTVWKLSHSKSEEEPVLIAKMLEEGEYIGQGVIDVGRNLVAFIQNGKAVLYDYSKGDVVYEWNIPTSPFGPHFVKIDLHPTRNIVLINVVGRGLMLHKVGENEPLWKITRQPELNLDAMTFSNDGSYIAMGDRPYIKLDSMNGNRLSFKPGLQPVTDMVWNEKNAVIGGDRAGGIKILDGASFATLLIGSTGGSEISSIAANNQFILAGDVKGVGYLFRYSVENKELKLINHLTGQDGSIQAVGLSQSHAFIGDKSTITSWDLGALEIENKPQAKGSVWDAEISPSGNLLGLGLHRNDDTSCVQIIDLTSQKELIEQHDFSENICTDVDWSNDGKKLIAGAGKIYAVYSGSGALLAKSSSSEFIQSVSFVDSKSALLGASSKIGILADYNDPIVWVELENQGSIRKILSIEGTSMSMYMTDSGYIGRFDWKSRKVLNSKKYFDGFGRSLSITEDGKYFAAGDRAGNIIFGQSNNEGSVKKLSEYNGEIDSLQFIDGGKVLQAGYHDGVVAFYEMPSLEIITQSKPHEEHVRASAWHERTKSLFTADQKGAIKVWKTNKNKRLIGGL